MPKKKSGPWKMIADMPAGGGGRAGGNRTKGKPANTVRREMGEPYASHHRENLRKSLELNKGMGKMAKERIAVIKKRMVEKPHRDYTKQLNRWKGTLDLATRKERETIRELERLLKGKK